MTRRLVTGAAMGCADAVPGVSGGTIAMIFGLYEWLIERAGGLISALLGIVSPVRRRSIVPHIMALLPVLAGQVVLLYLGTKLLVGHYEIPHTIATQDAAFAHLAAHPPEGWLLAPATAPLVFALFFGLVCGSVSVPWRLRRHARPGRDWPLLGIGALIAAALGIMPSLGAAPSYPLFVAAAALAVSVMILPGVSGSLVLLVLGLYQPIAEAVHSRDLLTIISVGCGLALGAALFLPLLRFALHHAHDRIMAFLSGLMLGSLVVLWPWKVHYVPKLLPQLGPMQPIWPSFTVSGLLLPIAMAVLGLLGARLLVRFGGTRR